MKRTHLAALTPALALTVGVLALVGPSAAAADGWANGSADRQKKHTLVMKDPDDAQVSQGEASQASIDAAALHRTVIDVKRRGSKPRIRSMRVRVTIGGLATPAAEPDLEWQTVNISLRTQDRSAWIWSSAELFRPDGEGGHTSATEGGSGCSTWRYQPKRTRVVFDVHGRCLKGVRRINRTNVSSDLLIDHDDDGLFDTNVYDTDTSFTKF